MGWIKCSKEAYEKCPYASRCASFGDAFFLDGSDCDKFNQSIKPHGMDIVPVVRCRECTHYNGHRHCDYFYQAVLDDDFCSYGERRTENGK